MPVLDIIYVTPNREIMITAAVLCSQVSAEISNSQRSGFNDSTFLIENNGRNAEIYFTFSLVADAAVAPTPSDIKRCADDVQRRYPDPRKHKENFVIAELSQYKISKEIEKSAQINELHCTPPLLPI